MTVPFPLAPTPSGFLQADWTSFEKRRNGIFYEGETPSVTFRQAGSVGPKTTSFEAGTNGATISTADPGTGSQFSSVTGSPTYDNTHAYDSLAMKSSGASGQYVSWIWTPGNTDEEYGRFYMYATANPASSCNIWRGSACFINILANGKLRFTDDVRYAGTGGNHDFTTPIALNQWVRIEFHLIFQDVLNDELGTIEVRLFNNPDSTTATETWTTTTGNPSTLNDQGRFGTIDNWGSPVWFDNLVSNATEWQGPAGTTPSGDTPYTYEVRDYDGDVVSSGVCGTIVTPDEPEGGWTPGWYRLYIIGDDEDTNFGFALGSTTFCVLRDTDGFPAVPASSVSGGNDVANDLVMKGIIGHTSRLQVNNAAAVASELADLEEDVALGAAYWTDYADGVRERLMWCAFPNGGHTSGQQAGVTTTVAALYPLGVTRFEGPQNEGNFQVSGATLAARMQSFYNAVKAGNPAATVMGPCLVDITNLTYWRAFGDANGFDYVDEIGTHAYNTATNGDINLGRHNLDLWVAMLAEYDADDKVRWQTEGLSAFNSVYRVYHPRRARVLTTSMLLFEQYGFTAERNPAWYDLGHGFWNFPMFLEHGDRSLNPQTVTVRVLAEETREMEYTSAVDFGTPGNNVFIGNLYTGASGSVVVFAAQSYMPGASVTFTVTGTTSPLVVVDGFGNETTAAVTAGEATVVASDTPTYVRLPDGVSVAVARWNDYYAVDATNLADGATGTVGATSTALLTDGGFLTHYDFTNNPGVYKSSNNPPENVTLDLGSSQDIDRVLIIGGGAWQNLSALIDFDVQITTNGTDWTTVETVDNTDDCSSFVFGSDSSGTGCQRETYWKEQSIHDISFAEVAATGVRLVVRQTSYGGEPDLDCINTAAGPFYGGQGIPTQNISLQEIGVYANSAPVEPPTGSSRKHDRRSRGGSKPYGRIRRTV